jgi:hypothetical protein
MNLINGVIISVINLTLRQRIQEKTKSLISLLPVVKKGKPSAKAFQIHWVSEKLNK